MKIKSTSLESYEDAPWPDHNIVFEDENIIVYKDGYPVTEGHLLFVPKKKTNRNSQFFTQQSLTQLSNHQCVKQSLSTYYKLI